MSALYSLLEQPRDKIYWTLVILLGVSFFLNMYPYDIGWKIGGASMEIFMGAGVTRIAYRAYRQGKRGAWIILCGAICYFIFFTLFFSYIFLMPNSSFLLNLSVPRICLYVLSFWSIPFAASIFLGLDFAFANRSLSQKLLEVETLSAKTIQQEHEKQQILASQNETLEKQVAARTAELKASQNQLIQKEKLASLGELTAGIAHEIQNPLNFVNNFSQFSVELAEDIKTEFQKPEKDWDYIEELMSDLTSNQEKINHHGKRASNIVKGMMEHSRTSSGEKEPTDINNLVKEYLNLSFHGMRAKEKGFNADYSTELDETIGKINIVPQEIGRVLLNIYNNAFYVVHQRKLEDPNHNPMVTAYTQKIDNQVIIRIKDNGIGIPDKIKNKVFQPFFTTKPTGEGTGLGLSLSYDMVVKGHGGNLEVVSKEGEGATFIIHLPIA